MRVGPCWCVPTNTSSGVRRTPLPIRWERSRARSTRSCHVHQGVEPMNLGLEGKRAIICASSRGLGRACAAALAGEGGAVVINGRDAEQLEQTAAAMRAAGGAQVTAVAADLCTATGRERLVAACPDPDILITNNGGPAPGRFEDWDHAAWLAALEQNLL